METSINLPDNKAYEQQLLFSEDSLIPSNLPQLHELHPTHNLSAVFDDCHNYIYANEGLLKDKIFHEMVKLLIMKLFDEQNTNDGSVQFGITSVEYRNIRTNTRSSFEERLKSLFNVVKSKYKGFLHDDALKLRPMTLAYVVAKLQYINLTKTPGDIKGQAFQAFVYRHQRGDRGEFFTPYPIVKLAVKMIDPRPHEKIIDPACGSGGFLIQALAYIQKTNPNVDKVSYIQENIRGTEFNPDVALSAIIRLAFEGGSGAEISCDNALLEKEELNNSFDIVLTNPPFGNKGKVEDPKILKPYVLARKWNRLKANDWGPSNKGLAGQSPDILFIERCLNMLRPGGRMAIVLPDGLLQNPTSTHIRFWIRSHARILGVVSIPQEAFIPYGTGIKTSLLLLQKRPCDDSNECFMARIQKMGYDVKGQPVYKRDEFGRLAKTLSGLPIIEDDIEEIASAYNNFKHGAVMQKSERIYIIPEKILDSRLDAEHYKPEDQYLVEHLKSIGAKPLGKIADILSETDIFRKARESEIRYIAISNVDARTMQVVSQQIMKAHEAPSRATYRVCKGDIITAVSGASTGTQRHATALITEDEDGAICSNGFAVIRNIHSVEPLFLLAFMRTNHYLRQVRRLMTGHAIPCISSEDLSKVLIPIPLKKEQKRIANLIMSLMAMRREGLKAGKRAVSEVESLFDPMH